MDGVTLLNCGTEEAVRIGLEAAGGKNLEVRSPTIGRQLLRPGTDRGDRPAYRAGPLGAGIRLYDNPGGVPVRPHLLNADDPTSVVNVRYRPELSSVTCYV